MKIIARYITSVVLLVSSFSVCADMQNEIDHLLLYIENSGCDFERNGSTYDSKEARSHIERKYNYVKKHVDAAEDFIEYAATESSMSGNKYQVTCNGNKQASADWLHEELSRYRAGRSSAAVLD